MRIRTQVFAAIFALLGIVAFGGALAAILGGRFVAFSFVFAFVSFVCIAGLTFLAQKKKILRLVLGASKEEREALANLYQSKEDKEWEEEESSQTEEVESTKGEPTTQEAQSATQATQSAEKAQAVLQTANGESIKTKDAKEIKIKKRRFWQGFSKESSKVGFKAFFMPLRLVAYGVFVVLFLVFLKKDWLDFVGFFSGLIVANIALVLVLQFGLLRTKSG